MDDDLKRRLRDEIDADLGARPRLDISDVVARGRGKQRTLRIMTALSAVLVGAAFIGGGLWASRAVSSSPEAGRDSIQPAANETTPSDEEEGAGSHVDLLDGEVSFRAGPWKEHQQWRFISDSPMGPETLLSHADPSAGLLIITDPAPLRESCPQTRATGTSAGAFVEAIRAHQGLSSTEPVEEQVAGVDALRLDIVPVDEASLTCEPGVSAARSPLSVLNPPSTNTGVPVITGSRDTAFGPSLAYLIEPGQRMRLYLLDLSGDVAKSLAVVIVAAEEEFDAAVAAAQPVLDSFEFRAE